MALGVLIKKEVKQFWRNPFLPALLVILPVLMLLFIPWVTTMDVRDIGVAVVDMDGSSLSRRVTSHFAASSYFKLDKSLTRYNEALEALDRGRIDVIVSIPKDFERQLLNGTQDPVSIVANGINAIKGTQGLQYSMQTVGSALRELQEASGASTRSLIVTQERYNPTGNYRHYMIPALMISLILLLCGFLPALNIVLEKESGTIEQVNVTPVRPLTFIISKLIPYWVMGLFELAIAMVTAWLVYGLVPTGSLLTIFYGALLFVICMSGFGVAMANISHNMQQTVYIMIFFVLVIILMSDMLTPLESMPAWAQGLAHTFPPTYFVSIMRSVYLKGAGTLDLLPQLGALGLIALVCCLLALFTYRKQTN